MGANSSLRGTAGPEAIQGTTRHALDCFASLAMTRLPLIAQQWIETRLQRHTLAIAFAIFHKADRPA